MSYNFQPRADSSDEEAGGIDLTLWKQSAKKAQPSAYPAPMQPPAPTAPMIQLDDDSSSDDMLATDVAAFQTPSALKRKHATPLAARSFSPPRLSFTSINQPTSRPSTSIPATLVDGQPSFDANVGQENGDEEGDVDKAGRSFVPIVPLVQPMEEEIEDFTGGDHIVRRVLQELESDDGVMSYKVEFEDRSVGKITFNELLAYHNGEAALEDFTSNPPAIDDTEELDNQRRIMSSTRPNRRQLQEAGFVSTVDAIPVTEDEFSSEDEIAISQKTTRKDEQDRSQYLDQPEAEADEEFEEDAEDSGRRRDPRLRLRNSNAVTGRSLRSSGRHQGMIELDEADDESDGDDAPFLQSDLPGTRKRKRTLRTRGQEDIEMSDDDDIGLEKPKRRRIGKRQSGRSTRHQGAMEEIGENDIFREESDDAKRAPAKPKVVGAREVFKSLPRNDEFRMRHAHYCDSCGQGPNFAALIYCQGCTLAYHKSCLGHRTSREHLVTKVADGDFVLQCRRCIAFPRKKDPTAPDQGKCSDCRQHGHACQPFRPRRTPAQEQKERDDNVGEDPIWEVDESRINKPDNVLFRCLGCWRAFHFEHLPSRSDLMELDIEADAEQRFREYSRDWKCKECLTAPAKVSGIIAWKPTDEDNYDPAYAVDRIDEDEKAYLVKWDGMSYFRACWMPGAWVWGTTAHMMRKAFAKRDEGQHPKMRTEDAIPEDYLRTDIVLDINFTSIVDIRTEEIDKARIREIDKALIKYKGLGYEDAVWEAPPSPEDGDRWTDFVTAYNDWVLGRYVRVPKKALAKQLEKARSQEFSKLEKKTQPENIQGGELMKYQIDGLNWLYYKWFTQKNAVLADEMGLGKTIQIIGFLATLVQDWNCFPFIVVVPNSTCPNWRREVKRWAPSLRVVTYYGSRESRDLAYRYELFPEGSKDLRCHVVVTSYDAAADENCRKFFRSVPWQGLIVDEGQRLKNDENLLYAALSALKVPFRVLLTGTPLQNNTRELFNLLHFLDDSFDASALEERFVDLDQDKINELHDMIRPFFLRRTKAQVLTFLPPMAQIILPVSMTIVQKKLYRTILAKNPELIKAIFAADASVKQNEKSGLNNILMQLRKCLCHPFVYNKSIEERNVSISASHRNLVDASSKLKLLELLLPKLRERGHRVLIFSQFLDMLDIVEDFLDGMTMPYQRLDGSVSSLQKQKRIDEFNAPESPLFAFLLSTRAGGVGINLATADTVIILDPDFNPHQDIQALSRAHRIGQVKKVLCFQLVTRASAEERIMQIGRKKLALDHVLIQEMDADDADQTDLASILRHGAKELFEDNGEQDVVYDDAAIDRLIDRSQIEDTQTGVDSTAETQFSHARVWANNAGTLQNADVLEEAEESAPDPGVWAKILRERERVAAQEAADKAEAFGRGRRARMNVDYNGDKAPEGIQGLDLTPLKVKKTKNGDESDTDFQAEDSGDDDQPDDGENALDPGEADDLEDGTKRNAGRKKNGKTPKPPLPTPAATPQNTPVKAPLTKPATPTKIRPPPKASAPAMRKPRGAGTKLPSKASGFYAGKLKPPAGTKKPEAASAELKAASKASGVPMKRQDAAGAGPVKPSSPSLPTTSKMEIAMEATRGDVKMDQAVSGAASAPLVESNTPSKAQNKHQEVIDLTEIDDDDLSLKPPVKEPSAVRAMLEALKYSNEPEHLVAEAKRYLRGLKGNLVQLKKQKEAKAVAAREAEAALLYQRARQPVWHA